MLVRVVFLLTPATKSSKNFAYILSNSSGFGRATNKQTGYMSLVKVCSLNHGNAISGGIERDH